MATLEDKILGEKLHNYCSSSEESNDENSDSEVTEKQKAPAEESTFPEVNKWEGTSSNTGPKGVIEDWRKYKQLENEKREESDRERLALAKKLTMTVRSTLEDERGKADLEDEELAELLNDDFLITYQKQRIQEMMQQTNHNIKFGKLISLRNGQDFLDAVDKENKTVTVVIHIYEENVEACRTMNVCLKELCKIYQNVKFCIIVGTRAGVSKHFKIDGVPALLVYKGGSLVGNFVRITNDIGTEFQAEDVQNFLIEHGLLEDKSCTPLLVKSSARDSDSDSD